jgi:hypothetical protein
MKRFWKRGHHGFDLEAELRANRPEPGREFLDGLAARVRADRPRSRRPGSARIAFAAGLSAFILVALASVGVLEYRGASHTPSHTQYGKRCGNPHEDKERKIKVPPCPVQAGNASAREGNSGTTSLTFPVTITGGYTPEVPVSVAYVTQNGTALAGSDYIATSGTLTFAVGETAKSVTVQIIGDTVRERDETFYLVLSNPSASAEIVDAEGVGTIVNDDKK